MLLFFYIYVICARYVSSYFVAYLQYIMISYDYYLCLSPYFVLVIASPYPNDVFWFQWDDSVFLSFRPTTVILIFTG